MKHARKDNFIEFARGEVLIRVGKNDYSANVIVGLTAGNNMILYDIINFTPTKFNIKKEDTQYRYAQNSAGSDRTSVSSNTNVPQGSTDVNTHSMQKSEKNSNSERLLKEKTRYSLETLEDGSTVAVINTDQGIFNGVEEKDYPKIARRYINEHFRGVQLEVGEYSLATVGNKTPGEYAYPNTPLKKVVMHLQQR